MNNDYYFFVGANRVGSDYVDIGAFSSTGWENLVLNRDGGNVGIGTTDPNSKLTVDGALRLIPQATSTCDASREGAIYYDTDDMVYICKNTSWNEYRGPQGIQGLKGDKGSKGDQGIQGLKGDKGSKGNQGIQGLTGPTLGIYDSLGLASSGNLAAGDAGGRTLYNLGNVGINGLLDMKSHKITNVTTPTANSDAATKGYVDGAAELLSCPSTTIDIGGSCVAKNVVSNLTADHTSARRTCKLRIDSSVAGHRWSDYGFGPGRLCFIDEIYSACYYGTDGFGAGYVNNPASTSEHVFYTGGNYKGFEADQNCWRVAEITLSSMRPVRCCNDKYNTFENYSGP